MKKIVVLLSAVLLSGCAELQQVANQYPTIGVITGNAEIAAGLKEALKNGINKEVSKLTLTDGFFKNQAVKIFLPQELQKVDQTLRSIGLNSLADEGLKVLNRAAEDAVKEATPVFLSAVNNMSFADAKTILLGSDTSATMYLQRSTSTSLYAKFNPIVKTSLGKVGADKVWKEIIQKYNAIPLVKKVNPDLNDYVTQKAMDGVFKMIAVEEKDIRTNIAARTSNLLRTVFALQDNK